MLKQVDAAVYGAIKEFKDTGKATKKSYDLKDDGVGYSTTGGFVDDIKPKLDEYKKKIERRHLKVSPTP